MKYLAGVLLSIVISADGLAQTAPSTTSSPVSDMIERAKDDLNNLRYREARNGIREVLELGKLRRGQEVAALEVASAAFYPEEQSARIPDSANVYLRRLARLRPIEPLPSDLAFPALDSQLVVARRAVFGAGIRPPLEITLTGPESRPAIDVAATRAARWQLYMVSRQGGAAVLLDTLGVSTSGKLSLRAHNGKDPIIPPGSYELRVLSISSADPDTIVLRVDAVAAGSVPTLSDLPTPLDRTKFLPERSKKARTAGIVGALAGGGVTWALANSLRPSGALKDDAADGRGTGVAIGISLGALVAGMLDRGRPLPANIKANAELRSDYIRRVGDATETNRKRVAEYKLAITINPEIK